MGDCWTRRAGSNWWVVQLRELLAEHAMATETTAAAWDVLAGSSGGASSAKGWPLAVPCLHVDVHGAQDPAEGGRHSAHVHLGLAAMERAGAPDVESFREALLQVKR